MYEATMIARIFDKATGATIGKYQVMELKYCIKDNVLWITDYRNHIMDFDLNECMVQIASVQ